MIQTAPEEKLWPCADKKTGGYAGWETKLAGVVHRSLLKALRFQKMVFILLSQGFTSKSQRTAGPFFAIVIVDRCTISQFLSCPRMTL
jgi:hypothetical protein